MASRMNTSLAVIGRALVATPFLLSGAGVLPEQQMNEDLESVGVKEEALPFLTKPGRALELVGGVGIATGLFPRVASCALIVFIVPATIIGHGFWRETDQKKRQTQLMNFTKNISMLGGLLFVIASRRQPSLKPDERSIR